MSTCTYSAERQPRVCINQEIRAKIYLTMSENYSRDKERDSAPVEVVLRRFFRDVQQSDIMTEIKARREFIKGPSRNARRKAAQGKAARRRVKRGY